MTEYELIVFVRHRMDSTNDIIDKMWNNGIIGIHYEDNPSFNASEYKKITETERKTLGSIFKLMNQIKKQGALVAADYRNKANKDEKKNQRMLIGIVEKGTEPQSLWYPNPENGRKYCYKTLKMRDVKEISFDAFPELQKFQPPRTTMCKWHKMGIKLLPFIYENRAGLD